MHLVNWLGQKIADGDNRYFIHWSYYWQLGRSAAKAGWPNDPIGIPNDSLTSGIAFSTLHSIWLRGWIAGYRKYAEH